MHYVGVEVAFLEWGQAPKPPSFVALRATTQSTRWSLISHCSIMTNRSLAQYSFVPQLLKSCIWLAAYMQNPSNILSTDKITNSPSQSPRHQYPYRKISSLGIYPVLLIGIWSRLKSRSVLGSTCRSRPILILI